MAIFGIGAYYGNTRDVSGDFIAKNLAGVGWDQTEAPELHKFIDSLKVGDIIYIKAFRPNSRHIVIKAIGVVRDDIIVDSRASHGLVHAGRNIVWKDTKPFRVPKPKERNNVRLNTLYEEFHPDIQAEIIRRI
jgi:hypothetical protein